MPDMLVKLFELPPLEPALEHARHHGFRVERAPPSLKRELIEWVGSRFAGWVEELEVSLSNDPSTCFVATGLTDDAGSISIAGFVCYDASYRNFFGPIGVDSAQRGRGLGRALLLSALHAQAEQGYAYAIVGRIGPADFYAQTVGATLIEPGVSDARRDEG